MRTAPEFGVEEPVIRVLHSEIGRHAPVYRMFASRGAGRDATTSASCWPRDSPRRVYSPSESEASRIETTRR